MKNLKLYPDSQRLRDHAKDWIDSANKPEAIEPIKNGEESVWDYTRPPYIQKINSQFVALFKGQEILNTDMAYKVAETASPPTYYFLRSDFNINFIEESKSSYCEWKGEAHYYSFKIGKEVLESVAWSYQSPYPEYIVLKDLIAFYPAPFNIHIDDKKVSPQPGIFYGGWVTDNIKGPFKGVPGSHGW